VGEEIWPGVLRGEGGWNDRAGLMWGVCRREALRGGEGEEEMGKRGGRRAKGWTWERDQGHESGGLV